MNGRKLADQTVERRSPEQVARFFDIEYAVPGDWLKDQPKATVRFQAAERNEIGAVCGLRMVRGDAER